MKVLILGKDPSIFFDSSEKYIGDSKSRHIFYTQRLRERFPHSEVKILTYTPRKDCSTKISPTEGLDIYGTNSLSRAFFLFDLVRTLPRVLSNGWRPDVITVQTPWEEGLLGLILSKLMLARFVPQLHFNLLSDDWCSESILNIFRRRIGIFVLKHATKVRVVSEELKVVLTKLNILNPDNILIAPVGVDFKESKGNKAKLKVTIDENLRDKKVILFVGRFCDQKNLELWVNLAKKVSDMRSDVMFLMAGNGDRLRKVQSMVDEYGISDKFVFLGNVSHTNLPSVYRASDIFLLTSHYEGFGRVVLEAMISGIPVVSTRSVGPEDMILDGKTGFLFGKTEVAAISTCLLRLLDDEALSRNIGSAAKESVSIKFSRQNLADRMIDTWIKS
jgi:glycosyltransferase involved in cell wall biosynthesis